MRKLLLSTLLFAAYCAALGAHAQAIDPVQFLISPEVPGPNEVVRIEVQGVGTFIGESNITWSRNGAAEKSGVGERVYTFTTGALGERTTVRASISSGSQGTIVRDFVFVPSLVNLVWEADTYTPIFYPGKALYTAGSPLKVVAVPTVILNSSRVANSSLSFQWQRNGEPVASASGLGRTTFSFFGDQLQAGERIEVDLYVGSSRVARGQVVIPAVDPLLLLYYRDPLHGVAYEQAFTPAISLIGKEIAVQAEPYFFSNESLRNGTLSYLWELNGQETTGPDAAQGLLTLRQEGGGEGVAVLTVTAQNNNEHELVQQASAGVQIVFGGQEVSTNPLSQSLGAAVATFNTLAAGTFDIFKTVDAPTSQQSGTFNTANTPAINYSTPGAPRDLTYQPLEPLPTNRPFAPTTIGDYLSAAFRVLIIVGALFAVTMLTVSGVRYMLAETNLTSMERARTRIRTSVFGLILLAASWLILNTINPQLLRFNLIIDPIRVTGSQPSANSSSNADYNLGVTKEVNGIQVTEPPKFSLTQQYGIASALGCGLVSAYTVCFASTEYISFSPKLSSDSTVKSAIENYTNRCEGALMNLGLGTVKSIDGSLVGAPGQTALVCQFVGTT